MNFDIHLTKQERDFLEVPEHYKECTICSNDSDPDKMSDLTDLDPLLADFLDCEYNLDLDDLICGDCVCEMSDLF